MFPNGETVIRRIWTPGEDDGYGSQGPPTWREEEWSGVAVAPAGSVERLANGSVTVSTALTIYDRSARTVAAQDEFIVRGRTYQVDADASGPWIHPWSGRLMGGTVVLKAASGG